MESVSKVMPLAVKAGTAIVGSAMSGGGTSDAAEARARAAQVQARRQAEGVERQSREDQREGREDNQHKVAAARVAAADSGLALSGTSLLNLESLEQAGDEALSRAMGEAALRVHSLLDSGAEQANSIRLSGRSSGSRGGGQDSLLRLGGQILSGGRISGSGSLL